jgi:hypothetical protein
VVQLKDALVVEVVRAVPQAETEPLNHGGTLAMA